MSSRVGIPLADSSNYLNQADTEVDDAAELNYVEELLRAQQRPGIRECLKGLSRSHRERILACIRHCLHTRGEALHYAERIKTDSQRTRSDLETKRSLVERLQDKLDKKEREVALVQQEVKEARKSQANIAKKAKYYEDQMTKAGNNLQQLQTQFHHEGKRKEAELQKLRSRVNQLLSDRTKQAKFGMRLVNPLKKDALLLRQWAGDAGEVQRMYYQFMDTHSTRSADLLEENEALRDSLELISKGMNEVLVKVAGCDAGEDDGEPLVDVGSLTDKAAYFEMPFEVVRDSVEATLVQQMEMLRKCFCTLIDATTLTKNTRTVPVNPDDREERLTSAVESVVSMLDAPACGPDEASGLDDSVIYAERATVEEEREALALQRMRYDEERARLNEEQREMVHAKTELMELRQQLEVDKMLHKNQSEMLSQLNHVATSFPSSESEPGSPKHSASGPRGQAHYAKWTNKTTASPVLTFSPRVSRLRKERDLTASAEQLVSFLNIDRDTQDQVKAALF